MRGIRAGLLLLSVAAPSLLKAEPQPAAKPAVTAIAPDALGPFSPDKSAPPKARNAAAREALRAIARREAEKQGLPFELADAVMNVESAYNVNARGADGEVGLMQVMPPTARLMGFKGTLEELAVPETNIALGVRYLADAWTRGGKDICTTVMKYRAGHGESRFSVLSVDYCIRVRKHLAALGYPVTGDVPAAVFGFGGARKHWGFGLLGTQAAARRLFSGRKIKSRANWAAYDVKMNALQARGRVGLGL